MKILFVFNHPAPYKVELLKRIAKELDIFVLFERKTNKDRNSLFMKRDSFSTRLFKRYSNRK